MTINLSGRIALITGASGGLGTAVTQAFQDAGATVIAVARDASAGDSRFTVLAADLTDAAAVGSLVDKALALHGRIDIVAHLAGGFAGGKTVDQTTSEEFDHMMQLNLKASFHILRAVIPPMKKAGYGRILAIGSRAAAEPGANVGAYAASKAALVALMRSAALENNGRGITVNTVLPSTIDTPGNRAAMPGADFSRWVPPARIAELLVYLASDSASQITGATIPIYGGDA